MDKVNCDIIHIFRIDGVRDPFIFVNFEYGMGDIQPKKRNTNTFVGISPHNNHNSDLFNLLMKIWRHCGHVQEKFSFIFLNLSEFFLSTFIE